MQQTISERFIDALQTLEESRDVEQLANLFADDADIGNVVVPEKFHGVSGARDFWTKYRDTFDEVRSTFRNTVENDDRTVLEWSTEGTLMGGSAVAYDGVSIMEFAEDKITRFRAYFDSAALGKQLEAAAANAA